RFDSTIQTCDKCGFMFATEVNWLDQVYTSPINLTDVGHVWRNEYAATLVESIRPHVAPTDFFVDYGAGYGLFVRMMRDRGFRFHWNDPYCENLFARGFDSDVDRVRRYRMATAFEVFEHVPDPVETAREIQSLADGVVFSTTLIPPGLTSLSDWDYFGLEHGQHVSFYSAESLSQLASKVGWEYTKLSEGWHYFGKPGDPFPGPMRSLLEGERKRSLVDRIVNRLGVTRRRPFTRLPSSNRGLIQSDYSNLKRLWLRGLFKEGENCDFEA
ncbi:MAG: class I SAM-dependent methyltransferase, partial [Verrucomicrobiota bacterium]